MGRRKTRNCVHSNSVKDRIGCSPTLRLRDLLRLGNNPTLFRNLKQHLYRIAEKHLDLEYLIKQQTEEWDAVEAELIATLPDIFEGSETLVKLACQVMKFYHSRRRHASKQQIQSAAPSSRKSKLVMSVIVPTRAALEKEREAEAAKNQKEKDVIFIDFTLDGEKHDEKQKNKVEIVEPKLPLMTDISNQLPGPATIKRLSHSTSPIKFSSRRLSKLPSSSTHNNSQNTPLHAESSSQAQSSNNARIKQDNHENAFELTGVTRVAGFLNACSPPMAHFLQPFIDFGCTSEDYLVAVSTWPSEKILHFLRQAVSRGNDKHKFSQMDILILQNHFISYFNKAQTTR